jgi:hypothetical protein
MPIPFCGTAGQLRLLGLRINVGSDYQGSPAFAGTEMYVLIMQR